MRENPGSTILHRPADDRGRDRDEQRVDEEGRDAVAGARQAELGPCDPPWFGRERGRDREEARALRIGLVTRSPQPEKPNAAGECEATTALPELFGETIAPDVDDWSCFRYRTVIAAVPLRNLVMGMTP